MKPTHNVMKQYQVDGSDLNCSEAAFSRPTATSAGAQQSLPSAQKVYSSLSAPVNTHTPQQYYHDSDK